MPRKKVTKHYPATPFEFDAHHKMKGTK